MEFAGRNVDQAVFRAAQELGRAPEDVEFEVLERAADHVLIRVDLDAAVPGRTGAAAPAGPEREPARGPQLPARPARSSSAPPPRRDAGERSPARGQPEPSDAGADEVEIPWSGEPLYGSLERMVGALIAASGFDLSAEVQPEGDCERVLIDGPDAELLTDRKGEGLSALEHLLNKMSLRGLGRRSRIRVDSAGFRKRREEEIVEMALRSAEKVKREGGEHSTSPLNPYERRLVHLALKEDPSIVTQSVGDGFLKRVSIRPTPARDEER